MLKTIDYMLILTARMVRDTLCLKGAMTHHELCDVMSVDPAGSDTEVRSALVELMHKDQVTYDIETGKYKANWVLQ